MFVPNMLNFIRALIKHLLPVWVLIQLLIHPARIGSRLCPILI